MHLSFFGACGKSYHPSFNLQQSRKSLLWIEMSKLTNLHLPFLHRYIFLQHILYAPLCKSNDPKSLLCVVWKISYQRLFVSPCDKEKTLRIVLHRSCQKIMVDPINGWASKMQQLNWTPSLEIKSLSKRALQQLRKLRVALGGSKGVHCKPPKSEKTCSLMFDSKMHYQAGSRALLRMLNLTYLLPCHCKFVIMIFLVAPHFLHESHSCFQRCANSLLLDFIWFGEQGHMSV